MGPQLRCSGSSSRKGPLCAASGQCTRIPPSVGCPLGDTSCRRRHKTPILAQRHQRSGRVQPRPWPRGTAGTRGARSGCPEGWTCGGRGHGQALRGRAGVGQAHRGTGAQLPGVSARPASAPAGSARLRAAGPCLRAGHGEGHSTPEGPEPACPCRPGAGRCRAGAHSHSALMAALLMGT